MKITYKPLFKLLIEKNLKKMDLCQVAHISSNSVTKMANGNPVKMEVIIKICESLHVNFTEIMELINDDGSKIDWTKSKRKD